MNKPIAGNKGQLTVSFKTCVKNMVYPEGKRHCTRIAHCTPTTIEPKATSVKPLWQKDCNSDFRGVHWHSDMLDWYPHSRKPVTKCTNSEIRARLHCCTAIE
ncbi:hypothetical protein T4A_7853 [Trichinella pseudospiralis]|uniref:Uncharacterized protein n=1 Tax=Trichinella pseudospiralis TaxID=6337 RepID=A0A0V1E4X0_TRIPS|nr:hypothetical protein T4A_7853 [Trichinella pseudospiralis]